MLKIIVLLTSLWSSFVWAKAPSQFGGSLLVGGSSFHGNLSKTSGGESYGFQIHTLALENEEYSMVAFLSIDFLFTNVIPLNSGFPYVANEEAQVNAFLFVPTACYVPLSALYLCFGLGQGTVNVNQNSIRRDYGTWNYHIAAKYWWAENWNVNFQIKSIGKVELKDGDVEQDFSWVPILLGVGYQI